MNFTLFHGKLYLISLSVYRILPLIYLILPSIYSISLSILNYESLFRKSACPGLSMPLASVKSFRKLFMPGYDLIIDI